jgi:transcriptional regulator with XRE-family HTH domain
LVRKGLKGDPDYAYGRLMLTLRTTIGLTQKRLANSLGISRRAVGEWEAGNSYPNVEHLKALIVLAVKNHAFATGNAAEEIRLLWKVARQKVLLDEHWLCALLDDQYSSRPHVPSIYGDTDLAPDERTGEVSLQVHIHLTILTGKNEM